MLIKSLIGLLAFVAWTIDGQSQSFTCTGTPTIANEVCSSQYPDADACMDDWMCRWSLQNNHCMPKECSEMTLLDCVVSGCTLQSDADTCCKGEPTWALCIGGSGFSCRDPTLLCHWSQYRCQTSPCEVHNLDETFCMLAGCTWYFGKSKMDMDGITTIDESPCGPFSLSMLDSPTPSPDPPLPGPYTLSPKPYNPKIRTDSPNPSTAKASLSWSLPMLLGGTLTAAATGML